ncbi:late embryogenesis abundant-like protein [Cinnamomum micranthum f. kanehirae]|uniref:Late embryogenesis abundant-like protein n=1 Tax=Cinnamomum micranthum f. kanehirae TaxID=337451 RepID=A0A443PRN3_9MAGN|nr:late embryogenesis abundant-like protein [Cinnamomum micranthum f. kanehirae]
MSKSSQGGFKKFCVVLTLIIIVVLVVLFFSILMLKRPKVQPQPAILLNIDVQLSYPIKLNVSLGLDVTIKNPNYGSFKYENGTTYLYYHGKVVADAPIESGVIPARTTQNISTVVELMADQLSSSPYFLGDLSAGFLNFTASSTLHGKASFLNILKIQATSMTECYISVFLKGFTYSHCDSKITI